MFAITGLVRAFYSLLCLLGSLSCDVCCFFQFCSHISLDRNLKMEDSFCAEDASVQDEVESAGSEALEDDFQDNCDEIKVLTKTSQSYSGNLLASLMKLKCDGEFCDVTIKSKDFIVKAHRLVLSSATEYFKAMFLNDTMEAKVGVVEFPELPSEIVRQCIEFIYSGKVDISMKTVRGLLDAGEMMQLPDLSALCVDFMGENVNMKTCAEILALSSLYNKDSLNGTLKDFVDENFEEFGESDDFIALDYDAIMFCLGLVKKGNEDCEMQKWKSISMWTNANLEQRQSHFFSLFKLLNLYCIPISVLNETIWTDKLVDESLECSRLIHDVYIKRDQTMKTLSSAPQLASPTSPRIKTISFVNEGRTLTGCEVYKATISTFPLSFNLDMDLVYYRGRIYVGTGLKIYQFSKQTWTTRDVDFSEVTRNRFSVTCPNCYTDFTYASEKRVVSEFNCRVNGYNKATAWCQNGPEVQEIYFYEPPKCCYNVELRSSGYITSCYNRCIEIEDCIYMLTRNYVVEYNISTNQICHHNVLVGLGNGFVIAASANYIFAIGGNSTEKRAVLFDLKTKTITHLASMEKTYSFGRAIFKDGRLYATNRKGGYTECYDAENDEWNLSPLKIPLSPAGVHFGANYE